MSFSNRLIQWYLQNKRDLPWRNTTNPYVIWLSEIILQQTRVAQGMPYFHAFLEKYPTVFDLAQAQEEEVLKLWEGLGYYSRARNLHATAIWISTELNGIFPSNFLELKKLKGIGDYTAAAIASFAYRENVPVVDGNVYRVLSRYFGISTDILSSQAYREFFNLASTLIDSNQPDVFNQAIMEFGSLYCVPKNPDCFSCVFNDSCFAFKQKSVHDYPVKIKKGVSKTRFMYYLILIDDEHKINIKKRTSNNIWKNLYEFDLIQSDEKINEKHLNEMFFLQNKGIDWDEFTALHDDFIHHKLTHLNLNLKFFIAKTKQLQHDFLSLSDAIEKPKPIVIHDFIIKHQNKFINFV